MFFQPPEKELLSLSRSFHQQVERLLAAGSPASLLHAVAETLPRKLKQQPANHESQDSERSKVQVMPYYHQISHHVKRVAQNYGVRMVFSAPLKLSELCVRKKKFIQNAPSNQIRSLH